MSAPEPPVVLAGSPPLVVRFDGSSSFDPDGGPLTYTWSFGDGGTAFGETVVHTYEREGSFEVTLTVIDEEGLRGQFTQRVLAFHT